jgi:hypothetical protein
VQGDSCKVRIGGSCQRDVARNLNLNKPQVLKAQSKDQPGSVCSQAYRQIEWEGMTSELLSDNDHSFLTTRSERLFSPLLRSFIECQSWNGMSAFNARAAKRSKGKINVVVNNTGEIDENCPHS